MPRRAASSTPSPSRPPKQPRRHRYNTRSRSRRDALLGGKNQGGRRLNVTDEKFRKLTDTLAVIDTPSKALAVTSVSKNVIRNSDAHFSTDYETDDLIVRRGAPFDLTLTFDRPLDLQHDSVLLQFTVGPRPQASKGTLIRLKLDLDNKAKVTAPFSRWSAVVSSIKEGVVEVSVTSPGNAIIGRHQLYVETQLKGDGVEGGTPRRHEVEDFDVIIIFNPWCPDDVVYMKDEAWRNEYVLNDEGAIWVGSAYCHKGRPWNFGQFDSPCLEAALTLLDKAELADSARRSPVSVIRAISALANSMDDDGVLEGRWTSDYPKECTKPWAWTGSVKIIQQFMDTDKPVEYGQCWVFSGIVTTLLRALGIPTRSVTNFESAHDCDESMTIDTYFDDNDEKIDELSDSVWNFHVWNESWLRRQDLPEGYDGWQAHDATPQELSEGVMRCGPAPLRAIKEGHVYLNYDVPFIFSEVNGDRVTWQKGEDGELEVIGLDSRSVGKNISTKSLGSNLREDLTHDYKYPEGSADERRVAEFVNRFSHKSSENIYNKERASDVSFDLDIPCDTMIGDEVKVVLKVKNKSGAKRSVRGRLSLMSTFYTGVPAKRLGGDTYNLEFEPDEEKTVELSVPGKDYQSKLNPEASLELCAAFTVQHTKQHFVARKAFTLEKPPLQISVPDSVKSGVDEEGTVTFTNPLNITLTNASVHVEGSAVMATVHEFPKPIKAQEKVSCVFTVRGRRSGTRQVMATFSSDQLCGVDGACSVEVVRNIQPMDTA